MPGTQHNISPSFALPRFSPRLHTLFEGDDIHLRLNYAIDIPYTVHDFCLLSAKGKKCKVRYTHYEARVGG